MNSAEKRRKWIKPAAIVFFAVMLLLTFFSNTILNWSLPEVSTYIVGEGFISAKSMGRAVVEDDGTQTVGRFPVTTQMADKLRLNEKASVSGVRLPRGASATLIAKIPYEEDADWTILVFKIENVDVGTRIYITAGAPAASYQTVVPNSAVREDGSGLFVLTLREKRTPLGNRYTAERAAVSVFDRDDTNSAVVGSISAGDTVIIESSKPIEPGREVKLAAG